MQRKLNIDNNKKKSDGNLHEELNDYQSEKIGVKNFPFIAFISTWLHYSFTVLAYSFFF